MVMLFSAGNASIDGAALLPAMGEWRPRGSRMGFATAASPSYEEPLQRLSLPSDGLLFWAPGLLRLGGGARGCIGWRRAGLVCRVPLRAPAAWGVPQL